MERHRGAKIDSDSVLDCCYDNVRDSAACDDQPIGSSPSLRVAAHAYMVPAKTPSATLKKTMNRPAYTCADPSPPCMLCPEMGFQPSRFAATRRKRALRLSYRGSVDDGPAQWTS